MTMGLVKKIIISCLVFQCFACGSGGLKGLANAELVAKRDECLQKNPTSPGRVTACENIRKECERRRKEGNFAC